MRQMKYNEMLEDNYSYQIMGLPKSVKAHVREILFGPDRIPTFQQFLDNIEHGILEATASSDVTQFAIMNEIMAGTAEEDVEEVD